MKRFLLAAALVASSPVIVSSAAMAQGAAPAAHRGGEFEARKQELETRLERKLACVKAASDTETLRACFPKGENDGLPQ